MHKVHIAVDNADMTTFYPCRSRFRRFYLLIMLAALASCAAAPERAKTPAHNAEQFSADDYVKVQAPAATPVYKVTEQADLAIEIRVPEVAEDELKPAIVFFFGGGWTHGNRSHFSRQAEYFTSLGFVTALVDYRVEKYHGTGPAVALEDAKSAIRWLRKNADQYGIDPNRLVGAGGSAGGHLAAAAAIIGGFNAAEDDLSVAVRPDALILWNPVIDNGPGGYGHDRVEAYWRDFSPFHNISQSHPPTLMMLGSEDQLLSVERGQQYMDKIAASGALSVYRVYDGQPHGFMNRIKYIETLIDAHQFLIDIGYTSVPIPSLTDAQIAAINARAAETFNYE